jgi:Tfp pilus assembly protein PilZ
VKDNYDQRIDQRFIYEAAIWHENIIPGRFYRAKIGNISRKGIYFESDQALYQGEKIYIGRSRPESKEDISANCAGVEIKWRKALKDSSYQFGYGAEFLDLDNPLVKSIDSTNMINQNNHGTSRKYKKDPREHVRELYRKEIVFSTQNRHYKGSITNISRSGAFIRTKDKFALGQLILLDIREDKTSEALRLKGWVVRLSPNGVGVKFDRRIRLDRRKKVDRRNKKRHYQNKS